MGKRRGIIVECKDGRLTLKHKQVVALLRVARINSLTIDMTCQQLADTLERHEHDES
jgi:hypothetical protein